jgi:hypothetical protein
VLPAALLKYHIDCNGFVISPINQLDSERVRSCKAQDSGDSVCVCERERGRERRERDPGEKRKEDFSVVYP